MASRKGSIPSRLAALDPGTTYLRTSQLLRATASMELADGVRVRWFGDQEAGEFLELVGKRSALARVRGDRDFYTTRAKLLWKRTIIEVRCGGKPTAIRGDAERKADLAEQVLILAASLGSKRDKLHSALGVGLRPRDEVDFIHGESLQLLSSNSKVMPPGGGIPLNKALVNRVAKQGFVKLFQVASDGSWLGHRIAGTIDWLFASKCEARDDAAIVKTAIAMEGLLVFSESESLARSLSERIAFLVTSDAACRRRVAKAVKRFYDARSGVVHGSKKKLRSLTPCLLDGVDRLMILALLRLAANGHQWRTVDDIQAWFETERWGSPQKLLPGASQSHLNHALALIEEGVKASG